MSPLLSGTDQALDRSERLADLFFSLGPATLDGCHDAVVQMLVEQPQRDGLQRAGRRRYLGEHVDAIGVLLDEALQPADLALDATQPQQMVLLGRLVAHHGPTI